MNLYSVHQIHFFLPDMRTGKNTNIAYKNYSYFLHIHANSLYARIPIVCMQDTFARAAARPSARATIGYLVYNCHTRAWPKAISALKTYKMFKVKN